jgi:2'-5' RNA ligase
MHRLFAAIRPPEDIRDLLVDAMDDSADFLHRTRGLASDPFAVERFSLFESRLSRHGAHYEEVASYALAASQR